MKTILKIGFKEIKDIARDKRSLFISLAFPLIFFPSVFGLLDRSVSSANKKGPGKIVISAGIGSPASLLDFLSAQDGITVIKTQDPVKSIEKREAMAAISFTGKADSSSEGKTGDRETVTIIYDNSSQTSSSAAEAAERLIELRSKALTGETGSENSGIIIRKEMFYPPARGESMLVLSLILPVMVLAFTAISPAAVSADLGAGEKERQTIEPLLVNPVSRQEIATGKLLAVCAAGMAGTISFAAGIALAIRINPGFLGVSGLVFTPGAPAVFLLAFQTILLSIVFSSAELSLSILAKSAREAQVFFVPLLMAGMACGYSATMIDPHYGSTAVLRHIPLINSAVLIKEIALGIFTAEGAAVTIAWNILYIILFVLLSISLFSSEKVIFRS